MCASYAIECHPVSTTNPYLVLPLSLQLIQCWHKLHETAVSLWTMQLEALILQLESILLLSPTEAPTYICHQIKSQGRCPKTMQQTNLEGTGKRAKVDMLSMCTVGWLRATEEVFHKNNKKKQISCLFWTSVPWTRSHVCIFSTYNISYKLPWIV